MHVIVTCKYEEDRMKKQLRKSGNTVFLIMSLCELSGAMETRVLIRYCPKPYAAFPHPSDASDKFDCNWPDAGSIGILLAHLVS